jgi:hypothetical protein
MDHLTSIYRAVQITQTSWLGKSVRQYPLLGSGFSTIHQNHQFSWSANKEKTDVTNLRVCVYSAFTNGNIHSLVRHYTQNPFPLRE